MHLLIARVIHHTLQCLIINRISLMIHKKIIFLLSCFMLLCGGRQKAKNKDYVHYYKQATKAESLIVSEKFMAALLIYEELFSQYDFIFLREYQVATQLSVYLKDKERVIKYLEHGISSGWQLKAIKSHKNLMDLLNAKDWKRLKGRYKLLRKSYEAKLNHELRKQVKKMFSKDQWKAFGALFKFSSDKQDKYAENKFAPHSEQQLKQAAEIFDNYAYPGEKLIGNNYWMSTILSHHNSISKAYAEKDQWYPNIKSSLKHFIKKGEMSPYEYALIDEWYLSTKSIKNEAYYGIITPPNKTELQKVNKLRAAIYLRPIEIRNGLVEIEQKTAMDFYLPGEPWIKGKIEIKG